jgi:hypothetical protein
MTLEAVTIYAKVYLGWWIRNHMTQLVLGPGTNNEEIIMADIVSKLKTAAIIAGATLFVVACGEKKAEAPAADTTTTTEAAPAADAMAAPADAMAAPADAAATDAMAAGATDAAAAAAPAADAMAAPAADAAAAPAEQK